MHGFIKIAAAVPRVSVCDIDANVMQAKEIITAALKNDASIIVFPELSLTSCSCGELFKSQSLQDAAINGLETILEFTAGLPIITIVGFPLGLSYSTVNCAAVMYKGEILGLVPSETPSRWFESHAFPAEVLLFDDYVPLGVDLIFSTEKFSFAVKVGTVGMTRAPLVIEVVADKHLPGRQHLKRIQMEQGLLNGAGVYVSAGASESTTNNLYSGQIIFAENGEILCDDRVNSLENRIVYAELDVDNNVAPYSGMRTIFCDYQYRAIESPERIIPTNPYLPADAGRKDEFLEEIFTIQSLALAKRLQHVGMASPIVGLSGGTDSTLALLVAVKAAEILKIDRSKILAVNMPGLGTSQKVLQNALKLVEALNVTKMVIPIRESSTKHLKTLDVSERDKNKTYENTQSRERAKILFDLSNEHKGLVVGSGNLTGTILGWFAYGGDHSSMYNVNGSLSKGLVREVIDWCNRKWLGKLSVINDILKTPSSPELIPADKPGETAQKTEKLLGEYEIHDFYMYYLLEKNVGLEKILYLAKNAFGDKYARSHLIKCFEKFLKRFFENRFKISDFANTVNATGTTILNNIGSIPSDASAKLWLEELKELQG